MNKIRYAFFLVFLTFLFSCNQKENPKPNILFLLADDLGYGDLGSYGQEIIQTPVLDDLAKKGMRFSDFYAGNAVCSASRAVLMTGKSSSYNSIRGNNGSFSDDRWMRVALKKDEITLGEMLRDVGYQTGYIGKWHLDDPDDLSTWAYHRGFDYALQEQWASPYGSKKFTPNMEWINGMDDSIYYDNHKWDCKDEFFTDIAFDYLDNIDKEKPFFLFMSYRAPHGHEKYIHNKELYADKGWTEGERRHAAKITLLDKQIGIMLRKLEEMGELENTLVLFSSDNGPHCEGGHDYQFFDSNGVLQGYKRDLYEGGIRVPFIAYWKGKIQAGISSGHIAAFQDLMPTIAEAVGINTPEQSNGISILPVLTGKSQLKHKNLNWELQIDCSMFAKGHQFEKLLMKPLVDGGFRQSARIDNWKAVRYGLNSETELYNLDEDVSESNNIAEKHPEIVKKMNLIFNENREDTAGYPYGGYIQQ